MKDYKDQLGDFANRFKAEKVKASIQQVKPIITVQKEAEVQLNVELPRNLLKTLKSMCVEHDLKIKEFIVQAIRNEIEHLSDSSIQVKI